MRRAEKNALSPQNAHGGFFFPYVVYSGANGKKKNIDQRQARVAVKKDEEAH